jgi:coproporphyrinogen III oxidase
MDTTRLKDYFTGLQSASSRTGSLRRPTLPHRSWDRPEGGGGISRLIEEGNFFERGGVNFSHVTGKSLPRLGHRRAARNWPAAPGKRWACRWCCTRAIPTARRCT